jgi:rhamnose transport system permease protein
LRKLLSRPETMPALLLIVALVAGALQSSYFLDIYYLLDSTSLSAEAGLLVLGMTFVIVSGNIDLSVASMMALVACVVAKLMASGVSSVVAIVAGLGLGCVLGAVNGALVAYGRLPSFLVTLGTLALYRGIAQAMMGAKSVALPAAFTGIDRTDLPFTVLPLPLAIFLLIAAVLGLVLHRTIFGRYVFAVGVNEAAAYYSAIPTAWVKMRIFMLSGFLAAVAGLLIDSRLGVARYDHARGLELEVITATVLAGTSIYGGRGSVVASVLSFLLIAIVKTGMGLNNVTAEYQLAVIGTLLVVAVVVGNLIERISTAKRAQA